jgi:ketosteroid isomerase-like protein
MSNADLLRHHIGMVARPSEPGDREIYRDDVVMTLMYSPEGHTHILEGPEAIMKFMARIEQFFEIKSRPEPRILETPTGAVAEYKGDMVCLETGNEYHQDYVAFAEISDGKIKTIREYYDPIRVLKAFGEM